MEADTGDLPGPSELQEFPELGDIRHPPKDCVAEIMEKEEVPPMLRGAVLADSGAVWLIFNGK